MGKVIANDNIFVGKTCGYQSLAHRSGISTWSPEELRKYIGFLIVIVADYEGLLFAILGSGARANATKNEQDSNGRHDGSEVLPLQR